MYGDTPKRKSTSPIRASTQLDWKGSYLRECISKSVPEKSET